MDCRSVAAFQGQDCGCPFFAQLTGAVFGEFVVRRLEFEGDPIAVSGMVAVTLLLLCPSIRDRYRKVLEPELLNVWLAKYKYSGASEKAQPVEQLRCSSPNG